MMAAVPESLEWSLPVPSVQELATHNLQTVPPRYVRDDVDNITTVASSNPVPLIDMSMLRNMDSQEAELQNLYFACKDWGIFQLINHGVSRESLSNMRKQTQAFFNLPLQEKKRWAQKPGNLEGYGQAFVTSEEQKLDWNDMIFLKTLPTENRKLDLWPERPQEFRRTLERYSEDLRRVAASLVGFMAVGLGLESREFSEGFEEGIYDVRLNYYPPCPQPERVVGIVPHADMSGISILLECGDKPGLQVLKDQHWVFVEPIDSALVVNSGHIIEILSNGIFKAPDHRAVVNKWKERLSVVTFCYPNSLFNVGPAKKLTKSRSPPLYKTVTCTQYLQSFYNRKLEVPFIDTMKM